jgi:serine/threonine protein kinase
MAAQRIHLNTFTDINSDFFETSDRYEAKKEDFLDIAASLVPPSWGIGRVGLWHMFHCSTQTLPPQGWKIHVSIVQNSAQDVLRKIVPILVELNASFKFLLDKTIHENQNSKNASRESAGKFITIYPSDRVHFEQLLETLHEPLAEFNGPYILSDRRYKKSTVLFYRYGAIVPPKRVASDGTERSILTAPDGSEVPDQRVPYFVVPEWEQDPFSEEQDEDSGEGLKNGRYQIDRVLGFSAFGGVYLGRDLHLGCEVVIKEARPYSGSQLTGLDAIGLLRKEHQLLSLLDGTGAAPRALDLFQDWEHWFLVQEFIDGESLKIHENRYGLALRRRLKRADVEASWHAYRTLYSKIASLITMIHSKDIVFSDVSHHNIIVTGGGSDARFIDFEAAFRPGIEPPTSIYTPGFAKAGKAQASRRSRRDDLYGLGAVMLAALMPINNMLRLNPERVDFIVATIVRDLGFPIELATLICRLLDYDDETVFSAEAVEQAIDALPEVPPESTDEIGFTPKCSPVSIYQHIVSSMSVERTDRLFPADPRVFGTNGICIAYGAAGVALSLHGAGARVPDEVLPWIDRHGYDGVPPGLYSGLSGVAWLFAELGIQNKAAGLADRAFEQLDTCDSCDVFSGRAGIGMALLKLFALTSDPIYLERAARVGDSIVDLLLRDGDGTRWLGRSEQGIGFAHGSAGTSTFLLSLALASGEDRYLSTGREALDAELALALRNEDDALTWQMHMGSTVNPDYSRVIEFR